MTSSQEIMEANYLPLLWENESTQHGNPQSCSMSHEERKISSSSSTSSSLKNQSIAFFSAKEQLEDISSFSSSPEKKRKHFLILLLVTVAAVFGCQNILAPNMSSIAASFKFDELRRDELIGGELTFLYYTPGTLGALAVGLGSGILCRRTLFSILVGFTATACLLTSLVENFSQLASLRSLTGFGVGGILPLSYSLIADYFPPARRPVASAFVVSFCGVGVFLGQIISSILGVYSWKLPFFIVSLPALMLAVAFFKHTRANRDSGALEESSAFSEELKISNLIDIFKRKTNWLILFQAFPGNITWGILIVYLHDFMRHDIGFSNGFCIVTMSLLAVSCFCGVFVGGYIGEYIYKRQRAHLSYFCAFTNAARIIPFLIIFSIPPMYGKPKPNFTLAGEVYYSYRMPHTPSAFLVCLLVISGGFLSTLATPNLGAMLLNANPTASRCAILSFFAIFDDLSKALGSMLISSIILFVGSRAHAFQLATGFWLISSFALYLTHKTFPKEEDSCNWEQEQAFYSGKMGTSMVNRKGGRQVSLLPNVMVNVDFESSDSTMPITRRKQANCTQTHTHIPFEESMRMGYDEREAQLNNLSTSASSDSDKEALFSAQAVPVSYGSKLNEIRL